MNRHTAVLALLATAFLCTDAFAQRGGRRGRDAEAPKLENYVFDSGALATELLTRGEARYYALLPKGWDGDDNAGKTFPWILWLPGFGGPEDFLRRGGATMLDELRSADKIPAMAVIIYRGAGRRSVYMNGEGAGRTEDLLTTEFLTHVQRKYRLSDKRGERAVMGVSAGGFGALKVAMRHSDKFVAVAAHSSAILPADPEELGGMWEGRVERMLERGLDKELGNPIDPEKWAAHMPLAIAAKKTSKALNGLQIYLAAGTEDHYGFYPPNEELAAALQKNEHRHVWHSVDEGGHAWSSPEMRDSVKVSLQFVGFAVAGEDAISKTKPMLAKDDGKAKDGDK